MDNTIIGGAGNDQIAGGNGSLTLKDFTAVTFNVNGEAYQISDDKFVPKP